MLNTLDKTSEVTLLRYQYTSDRYLIDFELLTDVKRKIDVPRAVSNFNRADIPSLKQTLTEPLTTPWTYPPNGVNAIWSYFKSRLLSFVDKRVVNYRPVSLLPVISKMLEGCIYDTIIQFIIPKLTIMQDGFLRGKSTAGQLLQVFSNISNILERRNTTDLIYFYISNAFDSVPHNGLSIS